MDNFQNYKARKVDKQVPGCLGRMVNLFDLSAGVSANRLLTDKPHCEGPLSRSQSDASSMFSPSSGNKMDSKMVTPDLRRLPHSNSHSMPMKMLLANEMSMEVESKHSSPNVIAKLMGLDALPQQQPRYAMERSQSKGNSQRCSSHSEVPSAQHWPRKQIAADKQSKYQHQERNGYKDVYEVQKESQKTKKPLHTRAYLENEAKKKMDLVRQKFVEAKRLATGEKFSQTKEFHDAVEVLSSNKDFFLKFLQEPNGLISKSQRELQSIFVPPDTKRITVLRPSKLTDSQKFPEIVNKDESPKKGSVHVMGFKKNSPCISPACLSYDGDEYSSQPTQIVVLKPSAGKMQDIKSSVAHGDDTLEDEQNGIGESRQMMKDSFRRRHKTLLGDNGNDSSTFSNGYGGDSSSFNKSEDDNFSDSEVVSPTSRHSWDYINRFGTPFSSSSLSRASYSPESSVCREAKKRLSERWAMMASNGQPRERRRGKGSNTLGEMLALSDAHKSVRNQEDGNLCQPGTKEPCLTDNMAKDLSDAPRNLPRSRSLPSSPKEFGERIDLDLSGSKEATNQTVASSFKGKVSSLFFSRSKKSNKESSSRAMEESQSTASDTLEFSATRISDTLESSVCSPRAVSNNVHLFAEVNQIEERSPHRQCGLLNKSSDSAMEPTHMVSQQGEISIAKPVNAIENQEQPSPISVLEPLFEEDGCVTPESSGKQLGPSSHLSSLIAKSPLIESVARSLTWDDSSSERSSSPNPSDQQSRLTAEQDEQHWIMLINDVLFTAGLNGGNLTFKWHSPETPLDPSIRNKLTAEEEGKSQKRSNRKLAFDCVNEAIADITSSPYGSEEEPLVDRVWDLVREWREESAVQCCAGRDEWDNGSLVVESMVRKEVVGGGGGGGVWAQLLSLEIHNLGKQIEVWLLQELVDEIVREIVTVSCVF